jgi:hypothetical protein
MSHIKQLLRLHQQGDSIKSIARSLGISKNTVKSYLIKLGTGKLPVSELLEMDDPVLEGNFHAYYSFTLINYFVTTQGTKN